MMTGCGNFARRKVWNIRRVCLEPGAMFSSLMTQPHSRVKLKMLANLASQSSAKMTSRTGITTVRKEMHRQQPSPNPWYLKLLNSPPRLKPLHPLNPRRRHRKTLIPLSNTPGSRQRSTSPPAPGCPSVALPMSTEFFSPRVNRCKVCVRCLDSNTNRPLPRPVAMY